MAAQKRRQETMSEIPEGVKRLKTTKSSGISKDKDSIK